ncbi:XRE family transcriptional regulator [Luteimonas sp. M1R5S18]|uniref:XRE family transcriptional regulator n=1 Tax=Luteimonas rhizosphaericola TaxID=3042024 RepID=A0ABT6JN86_9GAMM|nr:XRE family transcriptional regulator [Luteimonas rhizosphaericola]MDH5832148.1 XRE family transcriptional regulator [Luteimonas rhizosphaericola]
MAKLPVRANDKASKPTPADLQAAGRLRSLWDAAKNERKQHGQRLTQTMVGDLLDIGQSAVSQYLNGEIPLNYRALLAFSEVLGVPPSSIRADLPEQQLGVREEPVPYGTADQWADITAYGQQVAAGDGMTPEEYADTHSLKFKRSSLRRKGLFDRKLSVFYARGDSMEPRIHDGDALLFDTSDTSPRDGHIYVVKFEGTYMVKRLHQYGKQWFLTSDNTADPKWRKPVPVEPGDHIELVGRVRWIGSWED